MGARSKPCSTSTTAAALCDKALLITSPVRTRCDQCTQYGPPQLIATRLREFGVKADATRIACTGCGRDLCHDGATVPQLVEGYCLSCRLDALHQIPTAISCVPRRPSAHATARTAVRLVVHCGRSPGAGEAVSSDAY